MSILALCPVYPGSSRPTMTLIWNDNKTLTRFFLFFFFTVAIRCLSLFLGCVVFLLRCVDRFTAGYAFIPTNLQLSRTVDSLVVLWFKLTAVKSVVSTSAFVLLLSIRPFVCLAASPSVFKTLTTDQLFILCLNSVLGYGVWKDTQILLFSLCFFFSQIKLKTFHNQSLDRASSENHQKVLFFRKLKVTVLLLHGSLLRN